MVGLIGLTMVLLSVFRTPSAYVLLGANLLVGLLCALWVRRDALSHGMSSLMAWGWSLLVFFTSFLGLLAYILLTRVRR
jgi:membrane protein implicated in regulation of membrane protease activity